MITKWKAFGIHNYAALGLNLSYLLTSTHTHTHKHTVAYSHRSTHTHFELTGQTPEENLQLTTMKPRGVVQAETTGP